MNRTIRLILEYDGTAYAGWQQQAGLPTVQDELQKALSSLTGQENVVVWAASRTDAGVHARGQVAAVDVDGRLPPMAFERGTNHYLPPDIRVQSATEMEPGWNPRHASRGKRYRYRYRVGSAPSALDRHRCWHVRKDLNVSAMQEAAQHLLGTHDFEAFRATGCSAPHAVRTMYGFRLEPRPFRRLDLVVVGNAFVKHMVRIFAGTLAEVGLGKEPPEWVAEVLGSRDRTRAGMTAPPQGLVLEEVIYDDRLPPVVKRALP